MLALHFEKQLMLRTDLPAPVPAPGEALLRTRIAGICNTDVEITRGYFGFSGILGHEFVADVVQAPGAPQWEGKRVVGEINAYCGDCATCRRGDPTHCPHRSTLGIFGRNGAMAEYFCLPTKLLLQVPSSIPDEAAVFTEPLAAACEILEQLQVRPTDRVIVLGDGKLGLLVAQVLQLTGCGLTVIGRHASKLELLRRRGARTVLEADSIEGNADIVVEATGSAAGFARARQLLRPRGTLLLKSTFAGDVQVNLSMLVVDEIRLIGSRCGPFPPALRLLEKGLVDVESMIHGEYPLADALQAFEKAQEKGVLKILLRP